MTLRLILSILVLASFVACGPPAVEADLALSASPRTIDSLGQKSVLKAIATDTKGQPGAGQVRFSTAAGSLKDGVTIDLSAGEALVEFTCVRSSDPDCTNRVAVTADWVLSGKLISSTTMITISPIDAGTPAPDAGNDAGVDAGFDAGIDAGVDAGVDAGTPGDGGITLTAAKPALITGTGDSVVLTATVTRGAAPAVGVPVSFSTNRGSFTPTAGTTTTMGTTDSAGVATATLYVSNATLGRATVTASADGLQATRDVEMVNVANLAFVPSMATAAYLVVRNAGSAAVGSTMTTLFWRVTDSNGMGVPNVLVTFAVSPGGAAGSTVSPQAVSNATGDLSATLSSGDAPGNINVRATVAATAGTASEISKTHPGTSVIFGVPSDANFAFACARRNMGALHVTPAAPPTRMGVGTSCTVQIQDRNSTLIPGSVPVQFLQEAGSISPNPTTVTGGTGAVNYNAFSNTLPVDVTPLAGEPSNGNRNPRDMLVTLVAIIPGEEQFFDASGNGRWDPGEWFVDVGEPFIDSNDNGVWDSNEIYFDTVPKNNVYDGPNGVWDNNIQIFRTTHVLWSGPFDTLTWGVAPPFTVDASPLTVPFSWGDAYLNPISPDGAGVTASLVGTTKGTVTTVSAGFQLDGMGMPILTEPPVQITESSAGSGVFTFGGNCDGLGMTPNNLTRCIRRTRFNATGWSGGTQGSITLVNASGPATTGTVLMTPQHSFSGAAPASANVTFTLRP